MMGRLLVVIDIQKEYQTPGRPYHIAGVEASLANAERLLVHARQRGWPVVHVKHLQDGEVFGRRSPYSDYIAGFEPRPGESEYVKGDYSCYSSPEFAARMKRHLADEVVVIGYGSTKCCLATIVDGYHRDQKFLFVRDASNAKRSEAFDERSLHAYATDILASYAKITDTAALLKA
ncbi:MAG: isochorismatase family cysteine hydrolase [Elusimicrobiota bacterium]